MNKKNMIDKVNKSMDKVVNESLPPLITFTEHEVSELLTTIIEHKLTPKEIIETFKTKLKVKGRDSSKPKVPKGAYL